MAKRISMIDLFAGCGGMTSGFMAAKGYKPVMAVEWDLHAAATYASNFGEEHMRWGDIAKIQDHEIPRADVIIGGPPCQGFSNLGTRDVNDPRNKLWKEYIRFVQHAKPNVFVIENVDRFLKSSEFLLLQEEVREGGLLDGYELTSGILMAANYGAPQRRKRAIVIGSKIGKIPLPPQTHGQGNPIGLKPWRTVKDAFDRQGLADKPETTALPASSARFFGETVPGVFKSKDLHLGRTPTDLSLLRYAHVPPGGGRFNLPEELLPNCWKKKTSGTTDVMGRMQWNEPSLTIRTEFFKPEKGQYLHPQWESGKNGYRVDRPITHREAALLQTFPDNFQWCGTKIQIAKQIGNAVPPALAEAIAKHLKPYLLGTPQR
ncbi:DNA cytosine methyltransferase [Streptomyces sp. ISL-43]|uniref:DNA cytosine methyltransferase n=1 Tax=Streptomyces sp. ISL-43 TaxID=2819183 RepID=UPI001BECE876|nr:DNA cytosine methyltransferase [Streptomyces sp. ISL-43]MBT2449368.1 DNA cytosine methyltransferase [Streptomyces sp. ISL-43]